MRVFEYQLVSAHSMAESYTSPSQSLNQTSMCCVQAVFSGVPVGSLKLQISNDNSNWSDYTGSDYAVTTAGNVSWNVSNIGFQYIRVVYTRTSGTGSLSITVNGKGV